MAFTYGGETPLVEYGLTMTVESPTGTTTAAPVSEGEIYIISGTAADGSGYKIAAGVNGNDFTSNVLVQAIHRMTTVGPMGVIVLGNWHQIRRIAYTTGAAPTLGQSIEISGVTVTKIKGKAFDGDGMVMLIDTGSLEVEVLN